MPGPTKGLKKKKPLPSISDLTPQEFQKLRAAMKRFNKRLREKGKQRPETFGEGLSRRLGRPRSKRGEDI